MAKPGQPDYILLGIVAFLIIFGILILTSASVILSKEKFDNTYYFLNHQLILGLIPGLILGYLASRVSLDFLKKKAPLLLFLNLIFALMVFLPGLGVKISGGTRWIDLKLFSFQPSEFLKLTFIFYLAAWLASRIQDVKLAKKMNNFSQTFIGFIVIIGVISVFLVLQPDISTLMIIISSALLMYFLAGVPWRYLFSIIFIIIGGLFLVIKTAPYRLNRIMVFFDPKIDPLGIGYQVKQALIAVGSGGLTGLGLGMSLQKFGFLPQTISDSIFAVFAEEMGFIGAFILILLFLLFLRQGFKIAKDSHDKFSQLAASGITFWIVIQAFMNIGSMIGIVPLAGVPLPFISYGGSALVSELIGVGILINISKK